MPKDEQKKAQTGQDTALEQRIERETRTFRLQNDGKFPTRAQLRDALGGGSFNAICEIAKRVDDRLRAEDGRMAALPDMPEDLRLQGEVALRQIWAVAKEQSNAELVDLRQAQRVRDEDHRRLLAQTEDVVAIVEHERDAERLRAEAAEALICKLEGEVAALQAENAALHVRLDERKAIFAQLGVKLADEAIAPDQEDQARIAGKPSRATKATPEPETGELPL